MGHRVNPAGQHENHTLTFVSLIAPGKPVKPRYLRHSKYDALVQAWVKNDHLGFEILYAYGGTTHKYRPDFLVRLGNGHTLVLETKGQDSQKEQTKRAYIKDWVRAVNVHGGFGVWHYEVSFNPADVVGILTSLAKR